MLASIPALLFLLGLAMSSPLEFEIITSAPVVTTHQNYLSFTIDQYYASPSGWPLLESSVLNNPFAVNLVKHLTPAFFRFGGTEADQIIYVMGQGSEQPSLGVSDVPFNSTQYDAVVAFVQQTGVDFVFDVNVLPRNPDGSWNSTNFEQLLAYTAQKQFPIYAFELGNEPDLFPNTYNVTITPQQLAADYQTLRGILDSAGFQGVRINGPALAYQDAYLAAFASAVITPSNVVDDVTWHHYYGDGPDFTVASFYSVTVMDSLIQDLEGALSAAQPTTSHGSSLWIGETSSTYNGGTPGASTSYAAGFLWLDKLGLAALYGNVAVCRQDFYGGNYGLFAPPNQPYPDYWHSVLFKQLIGTNVLTITNSTSLGRMTRVYAFCARNVSGGVAVLAININLTPSSFVFQSNFSMFPRQEYHLTAPNADLSSYQVELNGEILIASPTGDLPPFNPVVVENNQPIVLNATSFAFIVFPQANAPACI